LSGKALERIEKSHLRRLIISDTIQPSQAILQAPNIEILSVAPLLGEAIQQIACDESVSNVLEMKGSFLKKKVKSQTSI
jgi:ribose-phosphate pyrophosphokinase